MFNRKWRALVSNSYHRGCRMIEEPKKIMRKHDIDNLRNYTILLLFPVHTFMIWNNFGSRFYIWQGENKILSNFIVLVNPWFMPILFVLAGMSARYALERRTYKEFVIQRIGKLLIPFISGMIFLVLFLFIPIWLMYYLGNFGGFSLGKSLALYLIGYYVLSNDLMIEKLERNLKWLITLCAIGTIVSVTMYDRFSYYGDLWVNFIGWITILVLLATGKKFLNTRTVFTEYFNQASYPIYILHQSILVALAYYIVQISDILFVQIFGICIGSFLLTVAAYHLIKWMPVVRKMIGIK